MIVDSHSTPAVKISHDWPVQLSKVKGICDFVELLAVQAIF